MSYTQKRGLLLLLGALLLALLVLAVSLPGMQLRQATLYSLMQQGEDSGAGFLPGGDSFITLALAILKGFMAIAVLLFPFYIYLSMQTKKGRRRLFGELITFLILLFLLTSLRTDRLGQLLAQTSQSLQNLAPSNSLDLPTTEVSFTPPASLEYYAQGLIWVAVALMALVVGLAAWFLARPRFRVPQAAETRQQIAAEAEIAVKELQAGSDFKDTILRCYAQMSQSLSEGRGLTRQAAMTPAEFAAGLKGHGLPETAVEELTHLFEAVRYGRQKPGPQAEAQAVACLNAIIEAVE